MDMFAGDVPYVEDEGEFSVRYRAGRTSNKSQINV